VHQTTCLPSGLTVVTERVADARSVAVGAWVGVGSRDEPEPLAGASHFLEHLLFKGTATRSAADIAEAVDAMGGDMNAFTAREHTGFHVRCLEDDAADAVAILGDIMTTPAFRDDEFESERAVIIEEILERNDEPADWVHDLVLATAWPDHPLGRDVLGEESTVGTMSAVDVESFFRANYGPANLVLAAAGAVHHDDIVRAAQQMVEAGPAGVDPPRRLPPATPSGSVTVDRQDTEQAHLCVAMQACDLFDHDRHALAVVDQILGGGLSSRLFQEVRERRGLAYSVYTYRSLFVDSGVLVVSAGTAANRIGETLDVIGDELERFAAHGVTARELDIARRHLVGSFALGLEDTGARMGRIASAQLTYGSVETVDEVTDRLRSVSGTDVERVARAILTGPRTVAIVGPVDDEAVRARVSGWAA